MHINNLLQKSALVNKNISVHKNNNATEGNSVALKNILLNFVAVFDF